MQLAHNKPRYKAADEEDLGRLTLKTAKPATAEAIKRLGSTWITGEDGTEMPWLKRTTSKLHYRLAPGLVELCDIPAVTEASSEPRAHTVAVHETLSAIETFMKPNGLSADNLLGAIAHLQGLGDMPPKPQTPTESPA